MVKRICEYCGCEFEVEEHTRNSGRKRFCSYECRYKAGNERVKRGIKYHNMICLTCGKPYIATRLDSVSCSLECRHKRNQQLAKERYQRANWEEKRFREEAKKCKLPQRPKTVTPAHEIEAEARKRGMNYGQYYALMLQKQEIEERERRKERNNE